MIHARMLSKSFWEGGRQRVVLDGLDLHVAAGQRMALLGRSGSGKSTLLNLLCGIDRPDGGEVWLAGQKLSAMSDRGRTLLRRSSVGFVFQFFNLLPTLSVLDNVVLPQRLNGVPSVPAKREARALLAKVGLADRGAAFPDRLSGGEQQRVAVVRAVAHRPALVLADEPTGNLDEDTGRALLDALTSLQEEREAALVMATHSRQAADRCARVLRLKGGRALDVSRDPGASSA